MGPAEIKPKKGELVRSCLDFVFGLENKRGELLDHWITFLDDFSLSPQEFYDTVEKELETRRFPHLRISREEFSEGGALSDKRIYLRFFRERLALYTCAAPFGKRGYFFSCRTVYVPAQVRLWHIVAALLLFGIVGALLVPPLGVIYAAVAMVTLVIALALVFKNAASSALSDVDAFLLRVPVVSTIYQDWFRFDTFYREDARLIYLQRIPALIRELAEEITAAKGAKLVQQYQRAPVLGELYKPLPPTQQPPAP
jgi:hypothetical protein